MTEMPSKNSRDVHNAASKHRYVYGEGSMGWEPEPELPVTRCVDPVGDARKVLKLVKIENPSARLDTEDAANRVALALSYLDMAVNP